MLNGLQSLLLRFVCTLSIGTNDQVNLAYITSKFGTLFWGGLQPFYKLENSLALLFQIDYHEFDCSWSQIPDL